LFEQRSQFGRVEQCRFPVGLGLVDALACLGRDMEQAADGIIPSAIENNAVLADGEGEQRFRSGRVPQRQPQSSNMCSCIQDRNTLRELRGIHACSRLLPG
jgi:hypothetical protein